MPDLQPADAEAQDAAVDNQLASAILAVWGWTGGPAARPLAGGVVHVTRPLAQARAQSEQETRYRAAQMALARQNELQYEEYQRRYESSRAAATAHSVNSAWSTC